ncbi:hypothetical protein IWQ62_001257 [Dispira parvispora]|uniref:Uncharacterized protein n=1 Tax=Dispira parvispora TaxID=1520584 RepID=A0A9W8E429_9FUNG|nr:hypothetical protein IWQ62_001257 [Dispira parvispora]
MAAPTSLSHLDLRNTSDEDDDIRFEDLLPASEECFQLAAETPDMGLLMAIDTPLPLSPLRVDTVEPYPAELSTPSKSHTIHQGMDPPSETLQTPPNKRPWPRLKEEEASTVKRKESLEFFRRLEQEGDGDALGEIFLSPRHSIRSMVSLIPSEQQLQTPIRSSTLSFTRDTKENVLEPGVSEPVSPTMGQVHQHQMPGVSPPTDKSPFVQTNGKVSAPAALFLPTPKVPSPEPPWVPDLSAMFPAKPNQSSSRFVGHIFSVIDGTLSISRRTVVLKKRDQVSPMTLSAMLSPPMDNLDNASEILFSPDEPTRMPARPVIDLLTSRTPAFFKVFARPSRSTHAQGRRKMSFTSPTFPTRLCPPTTNHRIFKPMVMSKPTMSFSFTDPLPLADPGVQYLNVRRLINAYMKAKYGHLRKPPPASLRSYLKPTRPLRNPPGVASPRLTIPSPSPSLSPTWDSPLSQPIHSPVDTFHDDVESGSHQPTDLSRLLPRRNSYLCTDLDLSTPVQRDQSVSPLPLSPKEPISDGSVASSGLSPPSGGPRAMSSLGATPTLTYHAGHPSTGDSTVHGTRVVNIGNTTSSRLTMSEAVLPLPGVGTTSPPQNTSGGTTLLGTPRGLAPPTSRLTLPSLSVSNQRAKIPRRSQRVASGIPIPGYALRSNLPSSIGTSRTRPLPRPASLMVPPVTPRETDQEPIRPVTSLGYQRLSYGASIGQRLTSVAPSPLGPNANHNTASNPQDRPRPTGSTRALERISPRLMPKRFSSLPRSALIKPTDGANQRRISVGNVFTQLSPPRPTSVSPQLSPSLLPRPGTRTPDTSRSGRISPIPQRLSLSESRDSKPRSPHRNSMNLQERQSISHFTTMTRTTPPNRRSLVSTQRGYLSPEKDKSISMPSTKQSKRSSRVLARPPGATSPATKHSLSTPGTLGAPPVKRLHRLSSNLDSSSVSPKSPTFLPQPRSSIPTRPRTVLNSKHYVSPTAIRRGNGLNPHTTNKDRENISPRVPKTRRALQGALKKLASPFHSVLPQHQPTVKLSHQPTVPTSFHETTTTMWDDAQEGEVALSPTSIHFTVSQGTRGSFDDFYRRYYATKSQHSPQDENGMTLPLNTMESPSNSSATSQQPSQTVRRMNLLKKFKSIL